MNKVQMPTPSNLPSEAAQMLPLRDIRLPAEPGFWPLAPGWWLLIVVLLLVLIWAAIKWYRYHQRKRRWMEIDQQLSAFEFNYQKSKDSQQLLVDISVFLRRFVKFQLQQEQATTYVGEQWTAYLDQLQPTKSFSAFQSALTHGVYQSDYDYDAKGLMATCRSLIRQQVMKPTKAVESLPSVASKEQSRV